MEPLNILISIMILGVTAWVLRAPLIKVYYFFYNIYESTKPAEEQQFLVYGEEDSGHYMFSGDNGGFN